MSRGFSFLELESLLLPWFRLISAISEEDCQPILLVIFSPKKNALMNYHQLTESERYRIHAIKKAGHRQKEIADLLERSPSTISRELYNNKGLRGYCTIQAQRTPDMRRKESLKAIKVTD